MICFLYKFGSSVLCEFAFEGVGMFGQLLDLISNARRSGKQTANLQEHLLKFYGIAHDSDGVKDLMELCKNFGAGMEVEDLAVLYIYSICEQLLPPTYPNASNLVKGWLHAVFRSNRLSAEGEEFQGALLDVAFRKFGVTLDGENPDPLNLKAGPKNMFGIISSVLFRPEDVVKYRLSGN